MLDPEVDITTDHLATELQRFYKGKPGAPPGASEDRGLSVSGFVSGSSLCSSTGEGDSPSPVLLPPFNLKGVTATRLVHRAASPSRR